MRTLWNTAGLEDFAKNHTVRECAEHFSCSSIAMRHYLWRHQIVYKQAEKGVKGSKHYHYKHGSSNTRLYNIWSGMKRRCQDPKHKDYPRYGARGIKICEEWKNDFLPFKQWALSHGYSDKLTLDRIDFNSNYEPFNCRWVTVKEQGNNRRSNRFITYKGETKTVKQWADELGIERHALLYRLNNWSVEEAFTKSLKRR